MILPLSVLDQSAAVDGRPADESIRDTLELAKLCEALGYRRFWVSEHHNHPAIVGTAPEIMVAAIAATTSHIRVGSAGVMLPHYATLKVAEQFRVLEAIAPGRIDLGVGRAPGSDFHTSMALNPNAARAADEFPAQLRDLLAWTSGSALPADHPFRDIVANPTGPGAPEPWVLGSSLYGAQVAAHFGLPYCFAWFFTDGQGAEQAMAIYRQNYKPSPRFPKPLAGICVWALAADSDEVAQYHFTSRAVWRIARDRNLLGPLPAPDAPPPFALTPSEEAKIGRMRASAMVGTPGKVRGQIVDLARSLQADEVAVVTWTYDPQVRRQSYRLLAEAFELPRR